MLTGKAVRSVGIGMVLALAGVFVGVVAEMSLRFNRSSIEKEQGSAFDRNIQKFGNDPLKKPEAVKAAWDHFTDFRTESLWWSLGTIGLLAWLALLKGPSGLKQITGTALGLGALFYPMSWLFAGLQVSQRGIERAMDSVRTMATVTLSIFVLGLFGLTTFFVANLFRRDKKPIHFSQGD